MFTEEHCKKAPELLKDGGDSGFEEKDTVLAYLKALDSKKYLVIVSEYANRPNNLPIQVLVRHTGINMPVEPLLGLPEG